MTLTLLLACASPSPSTPEDSACPVGDEACPGLSCQHVQESGDGAPDGVYWLVAADESVTYQAWCDMSSRSGGWTQVWKQVNHESSSALTNPDLAGSEVLLSPALDRSSKGSILDLVDHEEMLFLGDDGVFVHVDWPADNFDDTWGFYCMALWNSGATCGGVDCAVTNYLVMDGRDPSLTDMSGLVLGTHVSNSNGGNCGKAWCDPTKHGRWEGECSVGEAGTSGLGDWRMLVR